MERPYQFSNLLIQFKLRIKLSFIKEMADILSGKVPAPESYDDGDQSPLKGDEFQKLKLRWATGLDYKPYHPLYHHLSDWLKVIERGDYQGFIRMIGGKSDEEVQKLISKRESQMNFCAVFYVIAGAKCPGEIFPQIKKILQLFTIQYHSFLNELRSYIRICRK